MDLKIEGLSLVLTDGKLRLTENRQQCIKQRVAIRLKTLLGTWYYNLNYGVDYFNSVFGKGRSKRAVDVLLQQVIMEDPLIQSVYEFKSSLLGRKYQCSFSVRGVDSTTTENITLLLNEQGLSLTTQVGGSSLATGA